jgi:hypothetical protein
MFGTACEHTRVNGLFKTDRYRHRVIHGNSAGFPVLIEVDFPPGTNGQREWILRCDDDLTTLRIGIARTDLDKFKKFWCNVLCRGIELSTRKIYLADKTGKRRKGPDCFASPTKLRPGCTASDQAESGCEIRMMLDPSGSLCMNVNGTDLGEICTLPSELPRNASWQLAVSTYSKRSKITLLARRTNCKQCSKMTASYSRECSACKPPDNSKFGEEGMDSVVAKLEYG